MKTKASALLKNWRISFSVSFMLLAIGAASWLTMPKEEDPRLKPRFGMISVVYPGATASEIEQFTIDPLEEELAEVSEIKQMFTRARPGFMSMQIRLLPAETATDDQINQAWQRVRRAMDRAEKVYPEGVFRTELNQDLLDQQAVLLAITPKEGTPLLEARDRAKNLKDRLLRLPLVKAAVLEADFGEQITIELEDEKVRELGLSHLEIGGQISSSNRFAPGGAIRLGDQRISVLTNASFKSVEEMRQFPIELSSGEKVQLGQIASIDRTEARPREVYFRYQGATAIAIGVTPKASIDLMSFGQSIRSEIEGFEREFDTVAVHSVSFQPDYVEERLDSLSFSLGSGIVIVALVLVLLMGARVGFTVATVVPVITLISLGFYALSGGVLHQISIAAFVLALGLLVDNVLVVVENIQSLRQKGKTANEAASDTISSLAMPLAAATGTTVAAFLPMYGSSGDTADFTRAIPFITIITLTTSYFFAVLITPLVASRVLPKTQRPNPVFEALEPVVRRIQKWSVGRRKTVFAMALSLMVLSGVGFIAVKKQFFPNADRNQLVVDLRLAPGTHVSRTFEQTEVIEAFLNQQPEVTAVSSFIGRSTPRFYYNLNLQPNASHIAQLIVETQTFTQVEELGRRITAFGRDTILDGVVIVRQLAQGPPVNAPIEVRLHGDDFSKLQEAALTLRRAIEETPGSAGVRDSLGVGVPSLRYSINDGAAGSQQVGRTQVAQTLFGRTRGLRLGRFRANEDPIDLVLTSKAGENLRPQDLDRAFVRQTRTGSLELQEIATARWEWQAASVLHYNQARTVQVLADVESAGLAVSEVAGPFFERLPELKLPEGVTYTLGGEAQESGNANSAIAAALPVGILVLLISLLLEFNSFIKVGLILITVPFAMAGIVPGLLLSGQPFGFLSLLGALALVGIVVNNAILLIDRADRAREEGKSAVEAAQDAIASRFRPIILTTLTTIMGLLPLALTDATLWPPFAIAIISGLMMSTFLTLFVVPALYVTIFGKKEVSKKPKAVKTRLKALEPTLKGAGLLLLVAIATKPVFAVEKSDELELSQAVQLSSRAGASAAADAAREKARAMSNAQLRQVYLPRAGGQFDFVRRDRDLSLGTPLGSIVLGERNTLQTSIEIRQSILDLKGMLADVPAANRAYQAQSLASERRQEEVRGEAAQIFLQAYQVEARHRALTRYKKQLEKRKKEIGRLLDLGRVSELDFLRVNIAVREATQGLRDLKVQREALAWELGRITGANQRKTPRFIRAFRADQLPQPQAVSEATLEARKDLMALKLQIEASEKRKLSYAMAFVPKVEALGQVVYQEGGQFQENYWAQGGVGLTWEVFGGGARISQASAEARERDRLEYEWIDLTRKVRTQIEQLRSELDAARAEIPFREKARKEAERTVKLEQDRYRRGKSSVSDLLDAEEVQKDQSERTHLAYARALMAWVNYRTAVGLPLSLPEVDYE